VTPGCRGGFFISIIDLNGDKALYVDLGSVKREGFESSIEITSGIPSFVRLAALDKGGNVLGYSEEIGREIGNAPSELPQLMVLLVLMACLACYRWRVRASISVPGLAKARDILDDMGPRKLDLYVDCNQP
jgi:hypothetical protein